MGQQNSEGTISLLENNFQRALLQSWQPSLPKMSILSRATTLASAVTGGRWETAVYEHRSLIRNNTQTAVTNMKIVAGLVLKSLKILLHLRLSSEVVGKSLEVVGNLRRSSEVIRNLWQPSEAVGKSLEIQIL